MTKLEILTKTFMRVNSEEKMKNLLRGILTQKELTELPVRLEIVKMLKKGVPQHKIAAKLRIGVATVTRGSKEIQKGHFKYI